MFQFLWNFERPKLLLSRGIFPPNHCQKGWQTLTWNREIKKRSSWAIQVKQTIQHPGNGLCSKSRRYQLTKWEGMGLPYLKYTGHSVWEIRSQHCALSREKGTKKIKKEKQSLLTWLRSLFPMDGNQKLEGGRVERTGGHNAKEQTWRGEKRRVGDKKRRGREQQRWREKEKD